MSETLHIEKQYSDRCFDTYLVEGLSVEEMNSILDLPSYDKRCDRLAELLDSHDNDLRYGKNIGSAWRCGYGIYGIRHFGGHLIVQVGNSCD